MVVHVELHLCHDPTEIGHKAAEHARFAHPAQHRFGVAAAGQDIHEQLVGARVTAHCGINQPGIAMRLAHRFGVNVHAFAIGDMEKFDQPHRVFRKKPVTGAGDLVRDDGEGADLAPGAAPRRQLGKKAQLVSRPLVVKLGEEHPGQRPDLARMQKEHLHEPFDRAFARPVGKVHAQRHFALQIEGQSVFGSPGDDMQVAAHRPEEVFRSPERAVFDPGQQPDVHQFGRISHFVDILADPVQRVQIAQAAFAFLDIGLDHIAAVAQPFVPLVAFGQLLRDELPFGAGGNIGPEPALRLFMQRPVAPHITPFEQGSTDCHVGLCLAHQFVERTGGMPDLQPQIPQEIEHRLDHLFAPRSRLVRGDKGDINI